ncbi:hypothetical protein QNH38_22540 [Paenibacillus polymyxa]|uniref:hypothetical protein n=1 Tax=Paenibacillus polymyxa TaxID=1406 RepID=UPI001F5AF35B|nr:hypothetical protein [Paenibacillus polymyxa]UNL94032.1 hypothetical protein CPY53_10970 [Paenibacillus polymyxa]WHX35284.1 hypothetical protein QNH38_22540 [Paenibacillus polymyxa]
MSNSGRSVMLNSSQTKIKIVDLEEALKSVAGMDIGISVEELKKTEYLLSINPELSGLTKSYEFSVNTKFVKSAASELYVLYKTLSTIIQTSIKNVVNPYEKVILELLYIKAMKYQKAQMYMEKGYQADIYPISATTFADRRRKAIKCVAQSFRIIGILEYVQDGCRIGDLSSLKFVQ